MAKTFAEALNEFIDERVGVTWISGVGGGTFTVKAVYDDYITLSLAKSTGRGTMYEIYHVPISSILNIRLPQET